MPKYPPLDRLAQLQQMVADFSKVTRVVGLADTNRLENDVEHSFGLALTAWYLHDKIVPELDVSKILQYALAHDIVELHAGDTYVFDTKASTTKDAREREALKQIEQEWPDFSSLIESAKHYMDKADDEARFVKAVDKLLPVIMIELGNDPSVFWNKNKITLTMERENKVSIHVSRAMSPYYEMLLDWLDSRGNLYKEQA